MSVRTILVVLLALICGGSAALGVIRMRTPVAVASLPETVPVVVAMFEIPRGQTLAADMLELKAWPKSLAPRQTLATVAEAVDRAAVGQIMAGEPVLDGKLAPRDAGRGLAALVPPGMRAYTIQTSRIASNVAGFILPGNRVDVLLTLRGGSNDGTGGGSSTTLLQAVEVMAVDQRLDAPAENRVDPKQLGSVTLLVSPDQAALLDLGQNMGTLTLSLRNPEDIAQAKTTPATVHLLRFMQKGPQIATQVPQEGPATGTFLAKPMSWLLTASQAALVHAAASHVSSDSGSPERLHIRTLRGRSAGEVLIQGRRF